MSVCRDRFCSLRKSSCVQGTFSQMCLQKCLHKPGCVTEPTAAATSQTPPWQHSTCYSSACRPLGPMCHPVTGLYMSRYLPFDYMMVAPTGTGQKRWILLNWCRDFVFRSDGNPYKGLVNGLAENVWQEIFKVAAEIQEFLEKNPKTLFYKSLFNL